MRCFWNTIFWCNGAQDMQRRRCFFKEGWDSSPCQSPTKWPVSLMQGLCLRSPSWGAGKGWGERRGGRRNCSTEVFLMTPREGSPQRGMMCGTQGQKAFLLLLLLEAQHRAHTPPARPFLKAAPKSAINKREGSDCPTRWNSGVSFCQED